MERKTINLKDFTMSEEGSGELLGYPSMFGSVDSTGDIIAPGAYAATIPDFLNRGFNAQGHDWSFAGLIGYPIEAKEDERGLFSRMAFHSTPDAQMVRTKAKERMAAGKEVALSIGFEATDFEHIEAKDYAEKLPQFVSADKLEGVLAGSAKFPKVRVLKGIKLYEYSLVSAPAQRAAQAVSVKSEEADDASIVEIKERLADDLTLSDLTVAVVDANTELLRRTKARQDVRAKDGRRLSATTVVVLRSVRDQLNDLKTQLDALTDDSDDESKPEHDEALKEAPAYNPLLAEAEMALLEMQMQEQQVALATM